MPKSNGARPGSSSKSRNGPASIDAIKTFKATLQEGSVDECEFGLESQHVPPLIDLIMTIGLL
jgi:hypothetical protein